PTPSRVMIRPASVPEESTHEIEQSLQEPASLKAKKTSSARSTHPSSSDSTPAKLPRGVGRVYRPSWRDKKSGEVKQSPMWWISYSVRGKLKRESSHSAKEA